MIYIIILLIVVVIIAFAIWWFWFKKPKATTTPATYAIPYSLMNSNLNIISPMSYGQIERWENSGLPISSYERPITVDEPSVVETERKLLQMARRPIPHPQALFESNLRRNGNPFVGDLKIKPRQTGVYVPLQAEPSDLAIGYFSDQ